MWNHQFSVPQIEHPLGSSNKKGSHVYVLLIVAIVLLLWHQIVLFCHQITMVASEQHLYQTIVLPRKLATGSIQYWLPFLLLPLVGILFELLRIVWLECSPKMKLLVLRLNEQYIGEGLIGKSAYNIWLVTIKKISKVCFAGHIQIPWWHPQIRYVMWPEQFSI